VTYFEATVRARARLTAAGLRPETATLDADLLARHALGWDLATWLARRHEAADARFADGYEALIERRLLREPVAYIRGVQEFWGREFTVTPAALIPRPETELLIECANEYLQGRPDATIVDVGTGSGCIAITLALEHPATTVFAVDISEAALDLARANAARLGASSVRFICGSLLQGVPLPLDLIVTNPPYIAERDRAGLSREVREHEPDVALYGGNDGWREIRALLALVPAALRPDGLLLMELGYGQSEQLPREVAAVPGLGLEGVIGDLQGIPRLARIRTLRPELSPNVDNGAAPLH
jgi:release factor glutamine methyltransferase